MHKVVREVESGHGLVPISHYVDSLPEGRRYAAECGGTVWTLCETHGWVKGEYCRHCLARPIWDTTL